ncbi:MAG: restriction endonuclease subunit M, partial [Methylococcaceae bacterium]
MKQGWEIKKLGEVLTIERGGSPRPIDKYITNSPDGINWIKISDATASDKFIYETKEKITLDGLHKTRIVNEGDFILSNSMSFGRPYIMKTTGCIHDGWLVLKQNGKKIFETEFLYYLLSSPFVFQQFNSKAAGSTVRNLNIALVSSVDVPLPPLPEQQRIVAILDEAFAAIAQAKANAEQNLKNAKELFESYLQSVFE